MIVLVSGATATMNRLADRRFGTLVVPGARNAPTGLRLFAGAWAMDNGCYLGFNERKFERMLDRFHGRPGCLFVTAPDVVGNATATLKLFQQWEPRLRRHGFPIAFVAQDGLTFQATPWSRFEAFFVGGTTEFKWSRQAMTLVSYAKAFGKHVHFGRVNSKRGLLKAQRRGADTTDGTHISRHPDIGSAKYQRWMTSMVRKPELPL